MILPSPGFGGAVVSAKGEIIGMTAGSPSKGAFAIPIHSVAEFKLAVEKVLGEDKVLLLVKHEGQTRYVTVK